jgi:hypothetical protein
MKELELKNMLSTQKFLEELEKTVKTKKVSYMDAVIDYCEKNNIEVETAASIIKSSAKMKAIFKEEAENLNFLPKTKRLPI